MNTYKINEKIVVLKPSHHHKYLTNGHTVGEIVTCRVEHADEWHDCTLAEKEQIEKAETPKEEK